MRVALLGLVLLLSGCALAPILIEKLVTVGVGMWGVQQHRERQEEVKAIKDRVDQIEQVKVAEEFPLP